MKSSVDALLREIIEAVKPLLTQDRRRGLLEATFAGERGEDVLNQIDFHGANDVFAPKLVRQLETYGEVEPGRLALTMLLESISAGQGIDHSERFNDLITRVNELRSDDWRSERSSEQCRTHLGNLLLPLDPDLFVGREKQLHQLDTFLESDRVGIVQIVADGGIGKSRIVWEWVEKLRQKNYPGISQAMGWSFYTEGRNEYVSDSQRFFNLAVDHFSDLGHVQLDLRRRRPEIVARAIADAFIKIGGVLILDGLEPLQYPPTINDGSLRDAGLRALFNQLRAAPPFDPRSPKRLVVVTTRWSIPELRGAGIEEIDLTTLTEKEGAELLSRFRLPRRPDQRLYFDPESRLYEELKGATTDFGGHTLALLLLASFLLRRYDGNLAMRSGIPHAGTDGETTLHHHASRIMRSYDRMFEQDSSDISRACRQVLCMLGLFDRPAPIHILETLWTPVPVEGLTDRML